MGNKIFYKVMRALAKTVTILFLRPKFYGLENIPNEGKIILAGNHRSYFDPLLVMSSTKRHIHFLAKKELWKFPKNIIFANLGLIPVDRSKKDSSVLIAAKDYIKDGEVVGVFPEGTRGKEKFLPFKIGTVKLAHDTNTKIVPFAITGKYKIFSKDLKITFGKPLNIKNKSLEEENERFRNIVKEMIKEK